MSKGKKRDGFALLSILFLAGIFAALIAVYQIVAKLHIQSVSSYNILNKAAYSAEAALNYRISQIKVLTNGYYYLQGSPVDENSPPVCADDNVGSGDLACQTHVFNGKTVYTYVVPYGEEPDTPNSLKLRQPPFGDKFQYLSGDNFYYQIKAIVINPDSGEVEYSQVNLLEIKNMPLFHFAAFYNKDLEIAFNRAIQLTGPIHTNGDLYLDSSTSHLELGGQVTASGDIYRGRKDGVTPSCRSFTVSALDPINPLNLIPNCNERTLVTQQDLIPFRGGVRRKIPTVATPPVADILGRGPGNFYFTHADLRLTMMANGDGTHSDVQVRDLNNNNTSHTDVLRFCPGTIGGFAVGSSNFYNKQNQLCVHVFDIDLQALFDCLYNSNWFSTGKALDSNIDRGGLVFYFAIEDSGIGVNNNCPDAGGSSGNAVRINNASKIGASNPATPLPLGLTIVTDRAIYIRGDLNKDTFDILKVGVLADFVNVLSQNWSDAAHVMTTSPISTATHTFVNASFLAGTFTTGGSEGVGGQGGVYGGGLENFFTLHEDWTDVLLHFRGSLVSLGNPIAWQGLMGGWASQPYHPPTRSFAFDDKLYHPVNLPPLTIRGGTIKSYGFLKN